MDNGESPRVVMALRGIWDSRWNDPSSVKQPSELLNKVGEVASNFTQACTHKSPDTEKSAVVSRWYSLLNYRL